jgi:Sec-independent protein translocase protein TatA
MKNRMNWLLVALATLLFIGVATLANVANGQAKKLEGLHNHLNEFNSLATENQKQVADYKQKYEEQNKQIQAYQQQIQENQKQLEDLKQQVVNQNTEIQEIKKNTNF